MAPSHLLAGSLLVTTLTACTSYPDTVNPLVLYNKKEAIQMSYCAELADNAYYVGNEKLRDVPKQRVISGFARGASAKIRINLIEDVYQASFENSWDYAVALFNQCAIKVANVQPSRLEVANLCAQKSLIASGAHDDKSRGIPKLDAYITYAPVKAAKPYEVVDWVYASTDSHEKVTQTTWERCIEVVSP
ncbi:hypothetical protein [Enterovibrio paralichthyis]|uniref:hypothetical protein n=1 Tax=Enterovibrio paralichthyis TaxID=2853805 RepID=UPI0006CFDC1D|nr:hypothetical protein [Enterovibrio paralichthyis]MBV7296302.1 hypothetical protein [Enterovibrio paralichthyis]